MKMQDRSSPGGRSTPAGHRLRHPQWQLATRTLASVLNGRQRAEGVLQEAFRAQRAMGARDRRLVGELVYGVLRDLRRLQALAGEHAPDVATLCLLHALQSELAEVDALNQFAGAERVADAQRRCADPAAGLTEAQVLNVPDDIFREWTARYGAEEAAVLAAALQQSAPVDLRVNSLKADRETARAALAQSGIEGEPTPFAPLGLRLPGRVALQATPAWRDGWVEPQDEGSQLLAALVAAQPHERVADYCAGAGGKTLALAAAMQNQGELWALDVDERRLARMVPRLQRAGVSCVQSLALKSAEAWLRERAASFDAVLVDAPCSGTGTWRRQPDARLWLPDFDAMTQLQLEVLRAAALLVRPGGRLIYATCSLMASENDAIVDAFLASSDLFHERDAGVALAAQGMNLPGARLRLLPHRHGTDGFFAAILQRKH